MFYPGARESLLSELRQCIPELRQPREVLGAVSPHAGYMYSGRVAGELFARIEVPATVIILAPNHTGLGAGLSLWAEGGWDTPLGRVPVDEELASELLVNVPELEADETAHLSEHSAEVQVPFLQFRNAEVRIVPVVIGLARLSSLSELGKGIATVIKKRRDVLVLASSDMTHREPQQSAQRKDRLAIDRMLALDPEGLYETVTTHNITMCGYAPAVSMLVATKELGAAGAELIDYKTSGDVTGDYISVVGYASLIVF